MTIEELRTELGPVDIWGIPLRALP
jgi:hypothetical protein